jgi:TRAP-type uncharacterized transport system substrate-binding protein
VPEPLPQGANFTRSKTLWEIGLHIAGNPETHYGGNRDMCIVVGTGSGETFTPWLRMATGAAELAYGVARGDIEMAFVNPSALLNQAYRGVGIFKEPLPLRIVAVYPSYDRFVCVLNPATGLTSLAQIKERKYPLRLSLREEKAHSTRVLIDQMFSLYGFSLADLESWGGTFQYVGPPGDLRRVAAMRDGEIDCICDEGIINNRWFDQALEIGWHLVEIDPGVMKSLVDLGWKRVVMPPGGNYPHLTREYTCISFSGWPIYTRASLPDDMAYQVCGALQARVDEVPWEPGFTGVGQTGTDNETTDIDIPLHPGAERWYREHGFLS